MIKAIIFDLDGTLLNTLEDIHCVLKESLVKFGLPEISIEQTAQYVGNGAKLLVERAVGSSSEYYEKVYKYYSKRFSECGNEKTRLYEGERETLLSLKKAGVKFAIVTNKPQRACDNVCRKFLSEFEFCKLIGQSESFPLKPDPASTLAVIKELKLKKEECIFVGDGETDVLTAKSAGVECISALWGFRSRKQLEAVGAKLFAEKFSDIPEIIKL